MDLVKQARLLLENESKAKGLTTGKVRSISSKLFKTLEDKSLDQVLLLCEQLLEERDWALGIIAYDWAFRVRHHYRLDTFLIFERWLKTYVTDWDDCDDFCTHAFGELIGQYNDLFSDVLKWTEHPNFAVRRAAAVVLIYPIKKQRHQSINPFLIADALMHDPHYLVLKGSGWMLKVLSQFEPQKVFDYLTLHKSSMPRVTYRYALEYFDKELKAQLMEA